MIEKDYLDLADRILKLGTSLEDRTGTGTYQLFGESLRHNLAEGFPLLTTKKIHFKSIAHELIWFLRGDTNVKYLRENGVKIWDEWAREDGSLGPVYGKQWRRWVNHSIIEKQLRSIGVLDSENNFVVDAQKMNEITVKQYEIDQVRGLIDRLKKNPNDRRAIVSAWNPSDIDDMALPPCHLMWQVNLEPAHFEAVDSYMKFQKKITSKELGWEYAKSQYHDRKAKYKLNLAITQRSADLFLGVPFNIASYALLMVILCNELDAIPGTLVWNGVCVHVYKNHVQQVKEQISRREFIKDLPVIHVDRAATVDNITFEQIHLLYYSYLPAIKAPVAV